MPSPASPEHVILVHGTGAGDPADRGDKWWQLGSTFAQRLAEALSAATVEKPFHWSGANSEQARRAAANALLSRLAEYERAGESYHLIGHSHGGSVIWHTLVASAQNGPQLTGLRSWATVGTPFLTYRAITPSIWRLVALLALCSLLAWLLIGDAPKDWVPAVIQTWMEGPVWPLIGVALLFGSTAALTIWAAVRLLLPLVCIGVGTRIVHAEQRAKEWYGDCWLGLWHPLDEPINGLAGTLGAPPRIAPRIATDGLLGLVPLAGPLVNRVLARAADEFAWQLITDRVQGTDIPGYRLLRVGRTPAVLEAGAISLSPELANELALSADDKSIDSVRRLRALLQSAYDRQGSDVLLDRIATVVSFQEIIHTSYFDHAAIADLLIAHIRSHVAPLARSSVERVATRVGQATSIRVARFSGSLSWLTGRLAAQGHLARPLQSLEAVTAFSSFIGPGLLLTLAGAASYDNVIAPKTPGYQVRQIEAAMGDPARTSVSNNPVVGRVIVALTELGQISKPIELLESVRDRDARLRGAQPLAQWFGKVGRWDDVRTLARSSRILGAELNLRGTEIMSIAFLEAFDRKVPIPDQVLQDIERDVFRFSQIMPGPDSLLQVDYEAIGMALAKLSEFDRLARMIDGPEKIRSEARDTKNLVPDYERCRLWLGGILGAIQIGKPEDFSSRDNNCISDKDLFYRRASAHLQSSPTQLIEKIGNQFAGYTYADLRKDFEMLIAAHANSLGDAPEGFLDDNILKYGPLHGEFERLKFNLSAHYKLEKALTGKTTFDEFVVQLITATQNQSARAPHLPMRIKHLALALLRSVQEDPTYLRATKIPAAISQLCNDMFPDLGSAPVQYMRDSEQTDVNVFSEVAHLLMLAGRTGEATQLVEDIYRSLPRSTATIMTRSTAYVYAAGAADRAGMEQLRIEAINQAIAAARSEEMGWFGAHAALQVADALAARPGKSDNDAKLLRQALAVAEPAIALVSDDRERTKLYRSLARHWSVLGELARARILAEKASGRGDVMDAYRAILEQAIADRRRATTAAAAN